MLRIKSSVQSLSKESRKYHLSRQYYERLLSTAPLESCSDDIEENPHFPNLFKPLYLGPSIGSLPNRVVMGSMHTGLEVSCIFFIFLINHDA